LHQKWALKHDQNLIKIICMDFRPVPAASARWTRKSIISCHYNQARPHSALGPGIPDGGDEFFDAKGSGHALPDGGRIQKKAVLGGLHHEYRLEKLAS
jgi:hypothetical protein